MVKWLEVKQIATPIVYLFPNMQEKEYKMCLEAYNGKSNEKATLVNRLMEVDSTARYLCNLHAIAFVLRTLCISIILLGVTRIIRLGPLKQQRFVFFFFGSS